ncbi:hypothetical protein [Clostridium sp.]|uniref:hypothetical protein n=1 Tax=Clostridium sp. TaxID=1506 RepID=UPI0039942FA1
MKKFKIGCLGVIVIIILLFIFAARSSGNNTTKKPSSTAQTNNSTTQKENQHDDSANQQNNSTPTSVSSTLPRNNSTAKSTTLSAGKYTVGENIQPGRYVIKSGDNSGNLVISSNGINDINATLTGTNQSPANGSVENVTCDLSKGTQIQISSMNKVVFTPASTSLHTILGAGTWTVGLDVNTGKYTAVPVNGSGNFIIYSPNGTEIVNQNLTSSTNPAQGAVQSYNCALVTGDVIKISSMNEVKLEPNTTNNESTFNPNGVVKKLGNGYDHAKLHSSPSSSSSGFDLGVGTPVQILGEINEYYHVDLSNGNSGYIYAPYVERTN